MIKRICKALLASSVILIFGIVLVLFVHWLCDTNLTLALIISILLLFVLGWNMTNI